jgi:hypothetical protein
VLGEDAMAKIIAEADRVSKRLLGDLAKPEDAA